MNNNKAIGKVFIEGQKHYLLSIGCQDAIHIVNTDDFQIYIICDGCSRSEFGLSQNQVGSIIGSIYIGKALEKEIKKVSRQSLSESEIDKVLFTVTKKCLSFFRHFINGLGIRDDSKEYTTFVVEKLMFSLIGLVVLKNKYFFFGLGDGLYGIDENFTQAESKILNNLSECLITKKYKNKNLFKVYLSGSVDKNSILFISSDGIAKLFVENLYLQDFLNFLKDPLTCNINEHSEDTTIQAFRKHITNKHKHYLQDDVSIVVAKYFC